MEFPDFQRTPAGIVNLRVTPTDNKLYVLFEIFQNQPFVWL